MISEKNIKTLISKMSENQGKNISLIKDTFGSLNYVENNHNENILHIIVDEKHDEQKCFLAIKSLLDSGVNPNHKDYFNYNFIQNALYSGYSEDFILKIIKEALKYNLDVNHVDNDKDTIVHTAIYSDDYFGEVINIYRLLEENGFDSSKKCYQGRNLVDAMKFQTKESKKFNPQQIANFEKLFNEKVNNKYTDDSIFSEQSKDVLQEQEEQNEIILTIDEKIVHELEKYGTVLNNKKYYMEPAIGRKKEVKNLMISLAQEKKNPLLVGESGVGKTSIVDMLAYLIQKDQVPKFLHNRIILEVNPSDVVSDCKYVGEFEQNMLNLINLSKKYNAILFIDEIHTIYGVGSTSKKDNDMSSILKKYIDRNIIKVIGATTINEYQEYLSNDALKRRFDLIRIEEPNIDTLCIILNQYIETYCSLNNIVFEDIKYKKELIDVLIKCTSKSCRKFDDVTNNPDLSVSIIDKAFAIAKVNNDDNIKLTDFMESIEYCDRIYESAKKDAISELESISTKENTKPKRVLIDISSYRR